MQGRSKAHFANSSGYRVAFIYPCVTLSRFFVLGAPCRLGCAPRGLPRDGQVLLFSPTATAVSVEVCWLNSGVMPTVPSVRQASRAEGEVKGKAERQSWKAWLKGNAESMKGKAERMKGKAERVKGKAERRSRRARL